MLTYRWQGQQLLTHADARLNTTEDTHGDMLLHPPTAYTCGWQHTLQKHICVAQVSSLKGYAEVLLCTSCSGSSLQPTQLAAFLALIVRRYNTNKTTTPMDTSTNARLFRGSSNTCMHIHVDAWRLADQCCI